MAFACLVQVLVMTINVILGPTKLALSLKLTVRYVGRMTDAVVYKLYSLRPLSTAANQQVAVSTCTIATYFGNLAPPCGCLHVVVHELCVRAPIGAIVI